MKLLACPRCREVTPDNENHPTGIKLCDRCQDDLADRLIREAKLGELPERLHIDELRAHYETALVEAYETEREINHALDQQADELHKGWQGDY